MKKTFTLTTLILLTVLFTACGEKSTESTETKVAPADSYLDSRVNALNMAKQSATKSNEAVAKQNEMIEKLTK
jgi:ABC-type Fe3+-citrate transport system substrate-binding protein